MKPLFIGAALVGLIPGVATPRDIEQIVRSGQTTVIKIYRSWDQNCSPAEATVNVGKWPQHGKLSVRLIKSVVPEKDFANLTTPCRGKPSPGFQISYTSQKGFTGPDAFSVNVVSGGKWSWTDQFAIIVK